MRIGPTEIIIIFILCVIVIALAILIIIGKKLYNRFTKLEDHIISIEDEGENVKKK